MFLTLVSLIHDPDPMFGAMSWPVVVMQSATSVAEPLSDPKVVAMITPCPEGLEPSAPTACGKGMGKAAADGWVGQLV
jgi:hypothetical protein